MFAGESDMLCKYVCMYISRVTLGDVDCIEIQTLMQEILLFYLCIDKRDTFLIPVASMLPPSLKHDKKFIRKCKWIIIRVESITLKFGFK